MQAVFHLLGGLGLFLVGMSLLTDGLTHFAGDSLRRGLLPVLGGSGSLADIDVDALAKGHEEIAALRQQARRDVMQQTAAGQRDPGQALRVLDSMLWLERTAHHVWRICHYLKVDEVVRANDREVVGGWETRGVTQTDSAL